MLKVELHAHTADDPQDWVPHSTIELIDHAAHAGYAALAITLHDRQLDVRSVADYASERGIVLIPGIERTIEGKHVLLLNFGRGAEDVRTFEDLARLKARASGLVIAPHAFFPSRRSLYGRLEALPNLFDAVERNAMYTASLDFNVRAERWAARHCKPVVGTGDVHRLWQLGTTYSMVDAEPHADAICAAIAAGRVRVESRPLTWTEATRTMASLLLGMPRAPKPVRSTPQKSDPEPAR